MSDKIQTSREPGICVETGYGRSADPSPRPAQKHQYSSSSSSNGRKQQNRNKGNYGSGKDKRQQYARPGPSAPLHYPGVSGHSSRQSGKKSHHYLGDQRWSGQRNRSPRQDIGRDGLKETENVSSKFPGVGGSPTSRPGSGDGGRRKSTPVSLNHLLNFTVAPTERRNSASGGGMVSGPLGRRRRARLSRSYNKEQFLQANCQFVVSASGDYSVHAGDPDRLVEWDRIEQVRLFCHQIPSCPICLYPPTAAKITRCGHVYCWSCVLHYLALGEKKWRKCPICYESIYKQDLKSVIALANPQFKVGDTITMKLMMREKGTTVVCPKSEWSDRKSSVLTLTEGSSIRQFVKLLSATPTETLELITNAERCELEAQLRGLGEDGASEKCFVEAALEELKVREAALKQVEALGKEVDSITQVLQANDEMKPHPVSTTTANSDPSKDPSGPVWTAYADSYFEGEFTAPFSDQEEERDEGEGGDTSSSGNSETASLEDDPSVTEDKQPPVEMNVQSGIKEGCTDDNGGQLSQGQQHLYSKPVESESPLSASSTGSPEHGTSTGGSQQESTESSPLKDPISSGDSPRLQTSADVIYFYQASDGQHLYIHPVNAKCLAKEYGGLENAPEVIKATVVEMEQLTMSEDVRCRYRYLSHLPLTCEFVLCELDLKPPLLSQDTLKIFSDDLQKRKQKRIKKKREERRRERKCEPNPEPVFHVPTEAAEMTPERFHDFLSLASSPPLPSSFPPHPLPSTPPSRHSLTEQERGALDNGDGESISEQSVDSDNLSSAPSFAQALRGKPTPVWPVKRSQKSEGFSTGAAMDIGRRSRQTAQEKEEEGGEVPSFQNAFNEALFSASVSVLAVQSASGGKPGSKTAKKGRKKLVLFSTGGMRGVN